MASMVDTSSLLAKPHPLILLTVVVYIPEHLQQLMVQHQRILDQLTRMKLFFNLYCLLNTLDPKGLLQPFDADMLRQLRLAVHDMHGRRTIVLTTDLRCALTGFPDTLAQENIGHLSAEGGANDSGQKYGTVNPRSTRRLQTSKTAFLKLWSAATRKRFRKKKHCKNCIRH
jgi:hypothetical protein